MTTRRWLTRILCIVSLLATAQPAAAASYTATAVAFNFFDISATGTQLAGISDADDATQAVALPFSFTFYDVPYNSLFVSSNGLITFGSANADFSNSPLSVEPPQAAIAPYWDDLWTVDPDGDVRTQTLGPVGSRQFIIQWTAVDYFLDDGESLTFQVVLFEGSTDIRFNYLDLEQIQNSATVGVKNVAGFGNTQLLFNGPPNQFVGTGQSTLLQVPEPATMFLVSAGLLGVAVRRRRR